MLYVSWSVSWASGVTSSLLNWVTRCHHGYLRCKWSAYNTVHCCCIASCCWCHDGRRMDSVFDTCLKDMGLNPTEAGHCGQVVHTYCAQWGRRPAWSADSWYIASTSVATRGKPLAQSYSAFHPYLVYKSLADVRAWDAASAVWQLTLCDPIWHAGFCSGAMLLAQTAVLLYVIF